MKDWINRVFVDSQYWGGMWPRDLAGVKADFRKNALKVLENTGADHAVYCHIEYDEAGEVKTAHFYNYLPMDEKTFEERTRGIPGTDFIGAVHKRI